MSAEGRLDEDVRALLEVLAAAEPTWDDDTDLDAARAGWQMLVAGGAGRAEVDHVEDHAVPTATRAIPVRVYTPRDPVGVLVWFHGGGFVLGDLESHDGVARRLALGAGCTVVAVDYRLGPEAPFPAAQDDARAAHDWVVAHAGELARTREAEVPIALGGDSAGAGLAVHVALESRGPRPAALVLACPWTDLTDWDSPSMREKAEGYLLGADTLRWFAQRCVPDPAERGDPRVSVALAPGLDRLPPTLVITAEHDPLRDQGEAFARRLEAAGVTVTRSRYEGTVHAFFGLVEILESGRRSLDEAAGFLRATLGASG